MLDESYFAALSLQYSSCGMIFFDIASQEILSHNQSAFTILCDSESDGLRGKPIQSIFDQSHVIPFHIDGFAGESQLIQADGRAFTVGLKVQHVVLNEKTCGVLNFQDISLQKMRLRDLDAKHEGFREALLELAEKNVSDPSNLLFRY